MDSDGCGVNWNGESDGGKSNIICVSFKSNSLSAWYLFPFFFCISIFRRNKIINSEAGDEGI